MLKQHMPIPFIFYNLDYLKHRSNTITEINSQKRENNILHKRKYIDFARLSTSEIIFGIQMLSLFGIHVCEFLENKGRYCEVRGPRSAVRSPQSVVRSPRLKLNQEVPLFCVAFQTDCGLPRS
jgi:hypothetical protein